MQNPFDMQNPFEAALEAAHAALQLGLLEQADALVVEAD